MLKNNRDYFGTLITKMTIRERLFYGLLIIFIILSLIILSPEAEKIQSSFHSSQLQTISFVDGNSERIDYINGDGKNVIAADKGYATCIIVSKENKKLYTYFDNKGEQVCRYPGYYALLREYDNEGNNISISYLDIDGKPCITAYGYAVEKRNYNDYGLMTVVRYFDTDDNPITTKSFGNGIINEYDENRNNYKSTYINESDIPIMTGQGYASVERHFYLADGANKNKVESEFYFDEEGYPVVLSLGQNGVHKEYNENGLESILTYLDSNGNPIVNNLGYTTVKKTYHKDNTVATEQYFDADGKPVSLSDGQYGIQKDNNQIVYLDQNGEEMFNLRRLLYNQTWLVIPGAIAVMMLSTIVYKKWSFLLLLFVYILLVIYMTLLFRDGNSTSKIDLLRHYKSFFTDSEARVEILQNIWLFIPLGAILYQLYPQRGILLVPIVFSIAIEVIQYITKTGVCALDDVFSNGLGGITGFIIERYWNREKKHYSKRHK